MQHTETEKKHKTFPFRLQVTVSSEKKKKKIHNLNFPHETKKDKLLPSIYHDSSVPKTISPTTLAATLELHVLAVVVVVLVTVVAAAAANSDQRLDNEEISN